MINNGDTNISLKDFIHDNQSLLSTMAALIAICSFVGGLPIHWLGNTLLFLSIAGVVTVWYELFTSFPKKGPVRLMLFKNILSISLMGFVLYWFLAFRGFWHVFLFIPLFLVLAYMGFTILKQLMAIPLIQKLVGAKGSRNKWQKLFVIAYVIAVLYGLGWLLYICIGAAPGFNLMLDLIKANFQ